MSWTLDTCELRQLLSPTSPTTLLKWLCIRLLWGAHQDRVTTHEFKRSKSSVVGYIHDIDRLIIWPIKLCHKYIQNCWGHARASRVRSCNNVCKKSGMNMLLEKGNLASVSSVTRHALFLLLCIYSKVSLLPHRIKFKRSITSFWYVQPRLCYPIANILPIVEPTSQSLDPA